jgi:hypothetical protein
MKCAILFVLLAHFHNVSAVLDHSNLGWTLSLNAKVQVQANMYCNANERKAIHAALLKAVRFPQRRLRASVKRFLYDDVCDNVCAEGSDCFIAHAECLDSQRHLMYDHVEVSPISHEFVHNTEWNNIE